MNVSTIRPGLLVSMKTSLRGGVSYKRVDIEADHVTEDGGRSAEWQTKRMIEDAAEFEAATVARSKARSAVASVCCSSSFGLLCPAAREDELTAAVADARRVAALHNAGASRSFVDVFVMVGRLASDDVEAARAIASEVRELLDTMRAGIADADPEVIREAANKARALGGMLTPEAAGKVSAAIAQARSAARELVKRVEKAGESAAVVVAQLQVRAIDSARFAFLDTDGAGAVEPEAPTAPAVDLPEDPAPVRAAAVPQLSLEV
jgi:hypothetical protein